MTRRCAAIPGSRLHKTKDYGNGTEPLYTPFLEQSLRDYPLYSQDSRRRDALCQAVFSIGNIRWYILEGQKDGEDFTLYGIVVGMQSTEYGYMSLNEMADVRVDATVYGLGVLEVGQDMDFSPCALSEIRDAELQSFLSGLYDD